MVDERGRPQLQLSLLDRAGEVPERSGLNWWNALGRDRNADEAYIKLPSAALDQAAAVFGSANSGTTFLAQLHDGREMRMQLEGQQGADKRKAKQITSKGSKALLGEWILRTVLHIPYWELVTREHLEAYGRTYVTFTRVGDDRLSGEAIVELNFEPLHVAIYRAEVERLTTISRADIRSQQEEEAAYEGEVRLRFTNYYERDPHLRAQAIAIHGTTCRGCGFDFQALYGERGEDYIEVHHQKPVGTVGGAVPVDPRTDLTVLCANCHRMVHRDHDDLLSLEDLQTLLAGRRTVVVEPEK